MSVHLAPKVKEKHARQWMDLIHPYLAPGEELVMLARAASTKADLLAVTNVRVLAFSTTSVQSGPSSEVLLRDTLAVEAHAGKLVLVGKNGDRSSFGPVSASAECLRSSAPAIRATRTKTSGEAPWPPGMPTPTTPIP